MDKQDVKSLEYVFVFACIWCIGGGFAEVVMTLAEVSSAGAKLFLFNPRGFGVSPSFTVRIVAIGPQ